MTDIFDNFVVEINRIPVMDDLNKMTFVTSVANDAFVTGSVRFGCATGNSDLDICIPIMYLDAVIDNLKGVELTKSTYNNGFKLVHDGITVNIIPLHPLEFCAWSRAAKMAISCDMFKKVPKERRYPMHEMLVAVAKLGIDTYVFPENYHEFM